MVTSVRYECARPDELDAVRAATPVAYLPWGALEWHGPHNPVGLDGLKAHGLCEALAAVVGGVVLPPVFVGTGTVKTLHEFPHTLEHDPSTVTRLCAEFLEQLALEGYHVIVIVTGHFDAGHVAALAEAVDDCTARGLRAAVSLVPDYKPVEATYRPDHAAVGETSYLLHLHPEMVDQSRLPADRDATLPDDGVFGPDPRLATGERGREMVAAFVDAVAPEVRRLLAGVVQR